MTKCEICGDRKATLEGFYYGERVNGCTTCLKYVKQDEQHYYVDEVVKCFMCGVEKHEDQYHYHTDDVCRDCREKLAEEDEYFPYKPVDY